MHVFKALLLSRSSQFLVDLVVFLVGWSGAYLIRFEGQLTEGFARQMLNLGPFVILVRLLSFRVLNVHLIAWRYIAIRDSFKIFAGALLPTILLFGARSLAPFDLAILRVPMGVIALEFLLVGMGACGVRMIWRLEFESFTRSAFNGNGAPRRNVLLVGAGAAGSLVVKELQNRTDLGLDPVGFVDDDPHKFHKSIQGVRVLGNTAQIPKLVEKHGVREVIISIANAASRDIRRIMNICEEAKARVRIIPGLFELLNDHVRVTKIRDVRIEDLLGRDVVCPKSLPAEIEPCYRDKAILVTGAGGSIGSELCRQLCAFRPRELTLLDKDENSIYKIDVELRAKFPVVKAVPLIADVRNAERLRLIFEDRRPNVIFHAAAHKHVPLMEVNVAEAVLNNICGTANVLEAADRQGAERLIFISSDKAVKASSVMGATKRIGEVMVQDMAARSNTRFACVRFGNVLGSRGSVVPLFQKQIAAGGPITLTHPDVERYFMSIGEAVQLILMAGTLGEKGEIFILDMGKLVKVRDLALDLIRLSGFQEGDIGIKYIGLRSGEKLYEEMLVDTERGRATCFDKIFVAPPEERANGFFWECVGEMVSAARDGSEARIRSCLRKMDIGYGGAIGPARAEI